MRLATAVLLLTAGLAVAADSNVGYRLVLDLEDGSRVVGRPTVTALKLQTDFAELQLAFAKVRTVARGASNDVFVVKLVNGDQVQGRLQMTQVALGTCFGKVAIPLALVRQVAVTQDAGGAAGRGLVLHYTFDDEDADRVSDKSGRGHDGRLVGAVKFVAGVRGQAIQIPGPRSYVVCDAKELNTDGWGELTVCAWVMMQGGRTPYGPVVQRGEVNGDKSGGPSLGTGGPYGGQWNSGSASVLLEDKSFAVAPKTFSPNAEAEPVLQRWYHLALTYDGRAVNAYVNGKLDGSTPVEPALQKVKDFPGTKLVIGSSAATPFINWGDMFFDGLIDEVRLYDRALTAHEIEQLYGALVPEKTE